MDILFSRLIIKAARKDDNVLTPKGAISSVESSTILGLNLITFYSLIFWRKTIYIKSFLGGLHVIFSIAARWKYGNHFEFDYSLLVLFSKKFSMKENTLKYLDKLVTSCIATISYFISLASHLEFCIKVGKLKDHVNIFMKTWFYL